MSIMSVSFCVQKGNAEGMDAHLPFQGLEPAGWCTTIASDAWPVGGQIQYTLTFPAAAHHYSYRPEPKYALDDRGICV